MTLQPAWHGPGPESPLGSAAASVSSDPSGPLHPSEPSSPHSQGASYWLLPWLSGRVWACSPRLCHLRGEAVGRGFAEVLTPCTLARCVTQCSGFYYSHRYVHPSRAVLEYFITSKGNPVSLAITLLCLQSPFPQPLAATNLLSVSVHFPLIDFHMNGIHFLLFSFPPPPPPHSSLFFLLPSTPTQPASNVDTRSEG